MNRQQYAKYEDINQQELQEDIEKIKKLMPPVNEDDFQHLLKMERWGRYATFSGYFLILLLVILELSYKNFSSIYFGLIFILSAFLISVGNVSRWANVTHPILHGGYDKVPDIPERYTKKYFAKDERRFVDWLDWIKPNAWAYEHNIMHHFHLGEDDDPDQVERNLQWLIRSKIPMWIRYIIVYGFTATWKYTYYAPNTLRILENKN